MTEKNNETFLNKFRNVVAKSLFNWLGSDTILTGSGEIPVSLSGQNLLPYGQTISERQGTLSWEKMFQIYKRNATVRACVDTRVSEVLILDWTVKKIGQNLTPNYSPDEKSKEIIRFLYNPNFNEESFYTMLSKVLRDLLIYDAGCILKNRNARGQIVELLSQDASKVRFIKDELGFTVGYRVYDKSERGYQDYDVKDIIYLKLHPITGDDYGLAPTESLILEISTSLNALNYNSKYFLENEVPDGILSIDDINDEDYEKARNSFRKTTLRQHAIRILANAKNARWISFRGNNKDMQFAELIDKVDERIMYVFSVNKNELGITESVSKSVAEVQNEIFTNKAVRPILALLEYHLTTQILWQEFNLNEYEFVFTPPGDDELQIMKNKLGVLTEQYNNGFISFNELREELGRKTFDADWANDFYVQMGKTTIKSIFENSGGGGMSEDTAGGFPGVPSSLEEIKNETGISDITEVDNLSELSSEINNENQEDIEIIDETKEINKQADYDGEELEIYIENQLGETKLI